MRAIWSFSGCNVDGRVSAPARCGGLDVTLSDNAVSLLRFSSKFHSCIKAMSERINKYGAHFVHAVNILVLFPSTVHFVFFTQGKMQMQCVKIYIQKYLRICVCMHTCVYFLGVYITLYIQFNEEQKQVFFLTLCFMTELCSVIQCTSFD